MGEQEGGGDDDKPGERADHRNEIQTVGDCTQGDDVGRADRDKADEVGGNEGDETLLGFGAPTTAIADLVRHLTAGHPGGNPGNQLREAASLLDDAGPQQNQKRPYNPGEDAIEQRDCGAATKAQAFLQVADQGLKQVGEKDRKEKDDQRAPSEINKGQRHAKQQNGGQYTRGAEVEENHRALGAKADENWMPGPGRWRAGILKGEPQSRERLPPTPIYFDYHATTPVDPRVWRAMEPYFTAQFGNPASNSHAFGWEAAKAVQRARGQVAALIGAQTNEVVFTSGATESNNLAIKGLTERHRGRRAHLITTAIEHHAVLDPCHRLEREGFAVTRLGVDHEGRIRLEELEAALRPETVLVSVMAANNEIGVLQEMEAIGNLTRARGIVLHSDATQAVGKIPVDVNRWQADLISLSAHKMYGPKGVGALYVRTGTTLCCQLDGGGHERGLRSGTLNVPGIVGLGAAAQLAAEEMAEEGLRLTDLRNRLRDRILAGLEGVTLNGSAIHRLPQNLHLTFSGVEAEALMMSMPEIAVSSGSACSSAARAASHVLLAIGLSEDEAQRSLRFGLGRFTTEAEVERASERVVAAARQLRELSLP